MANAKKVTAERIATVSTLPPWMPPVIPPPPGPIIHPCHPCHDDDNDGDFKLAQYASANDFPDIGSDKILYVDLSTQKLYYWKDNGYFSVDGDCNCDFSIDGSILYGGNAYDEEK